MGTGDFEVGMARTDQIERHTDENGKPIDPGMCIPTSFFFRKVSSVIGFVFLQNYVF